MRAFKTQEKLTRFYLLHYTTNQDQDQSPQNKCQHGPCSDTQFISYLLNIYKAQMTARGGGV